MIRTPFVIASTDDYVTLATHGSTYSSIDFHLHGTVHTVHI
jgi:hypothetical protein